MVVCFSWDLTGPITNLIFRVFICRSWPIRVSLTNWAGWRVLMQCVCDRNGKRYMWHEANNHSLLTFTCSYITKKQKQTAVVIVCKIKKRLAKCLMTQGHCPEEVTLTTGAYDHLVEAISKWWLCVALPVSGDQFSSRHETLTHVNMNQRTHGSDESMPWINLLSKSVLKKERKKELCYNQPAYSRIILTTYAWKYRNGRVYSSILPLCSESALMKTSIRCLQTPCDLHSPFYISCYIRTRPAS